MFSNSWPIELSAGSVVPEQTELFHICNKAIFLYYILYQLVFNHDFRIQDKNNKAKI